MWKLVCLVILLITNNVHVHGNVESHSGCLADVFAVTVDKCNIVPKSIAKCCNVTGCINLLQQTQEMYGKEYTCIRFF